jgi:hypothetical protein
MHSRSLTLCPSTEATDLRRKRSALYAGMTTDTSGFMTDQKSKRHALGNSRSFLQITPAQSRTVAHWPRIRAGCPDQKIV